MTINMLSKTQNELLEEMGQIQKQVFGPKETKTLTCLGILYQT